MNTTDSTLAPKLATAIAKAIDAGETLTAEAISRVAVNVKTAGLMVTPLPEQEQPRVSSKAQRHPSGVEVIANRWVVNVDGHFAGIVSIDMLGRVVEGARYDAYYGFTHSIHDSLDAAVAHLVAQQRTPSPERSIERGRDDAEEDSRRESEAVQ